MVSHLQEVARVKPPADTRVRSEAFAFDEVAS